MALGWLLNLGFAGGTAIEGSTDVLVFDELTESEFDDLTESEFDIMIESESSESSSSVTGRGLYKVAGQVYVAGIRAGEVHG